MAGRNITFEVEKLIQPIYNGGDVALDAEARTLATCLDEEVILTDLTNGETLARIPGDGEALTALLITPSASHLITCSRSLSMRFYTLEFIEDSRQIEATLRRTVKPHSTPVVSATIDQTGTLVATGGADGAVKVWDIRGGYLSHTFRGHSGIVSALHFFQPATKEAPSKAAQKSRPSSRPGVDRLEESTNGTVQEGHASNVLFLAFAGENGQIRVWDLVKRKAVASLDSHVSVVRALAYSPRHSLLVSASRDKTIVFWDATSWKLQTALSVEEETESIGFLDGGAYLFTGGSRGHVRLRDPKSGRETTREQRIGGEGDSIIQLVHNPKHHLLLSIHADQSLILHSLDTLSHPQAGSLIDPLPILRRIAGTHDEVIDLALVSSTRNLIALAANSEAIRLVDVTTRPEHEEAESQRQYFGSEVALLEGHEDIVICLDVDWSGCWLATGAKDNKARLWRIFEDGRSSSCEATLSGHAESLGAIALPTMAPQTESPAFKDPLTHPPPFLITGSQDKTVKKWNIPTGLVSGSKNDTPRAAFTRKAHDKDINAIEINSTSTLFASASQDRTVKIWSVEEGETLGVLRGHKRGVWSVRFVPRDFPPIAGESGPASARGLVLTGSGDKTVKLWSLTDYGCLRTFEGHSHNVLKVVWLPPAPRRPSGGDADDTPVAPPRRTLFASAGADGLVKIWDASLGECVATLDNHSDRVWALAAEPGTGRLVSGGGDGVVTFWADTSAATAATAAAAASARVEQDQQLQNHARRGNYREAIVLALQLRHPARLLALFTDVARRHPPEAGSISGLRAVDEVVASLDDEQLFELLLRLRDWNTNARTAPVAQRIFNVVVRSYPAARLVGLRRKGKGLGEVLEALRAYTERHYRRCEELMEESYLVDFIVQGMAGM